MESLPVNVTDIFLFSLIKTYSFRKYKLSLKKKERELNS